MRLFMIVSKIAFNMLPILLGVLLLSLQAHCEIVAPNPLVIGETMEVKCSVDNIGGSGKLTGISGLQIVSFIKLSKVESGTSSMIASFLPFSTVGSKKYGPEVDRNSITMDGGGSGVQSNINTIYIAMKVNRADCNNVIAYECEFEYFTRDDQSLTDRKVFTENTTAKTDVSKIFVSAVPDNSDTIGYELGESINFECRISGDEGMDIQWEIERCQNKGTFYPINDFTFGDRNAVVTKDDQPLTKSRCSDPVMQFSSKLVFNTSDIFCHIQCKVFDSERNQIREYESSSNFANGTKNVEANDPSTDPASAGAGSDDTGMIVGIVIGLLVLIVVILLVVYFCWYKKRDQAAAEDKYKPDAENGPKDGMHAPPPVFFTKPGLDDKDNSTTGKGDKPSRSRRSKSRDSYNDDEADKNLNEDGEVKPRPRSRGSRDGSDRRRNRETEGRQGDDRYDDNDNRRDGGRSRKPSDKRSQHDDSKYDDGNAYASTDVSPSEDDRSQRVYKPKPRGRSRRTSDLDEEEEKPLHYAELDLKKSEDKPDGRVRGRTERGRDSNRRKERHDPVEYASIRV